MNKLKNEVKRDNSSKEELLAQRVCFQETGDTVFYQFKNYTAETQ